jgi:hypothetical protein
MVPGLGKLIFVGFGLNENGLNEGGEFMILGDVNLVTVQGKSLSRKPRMKRLEFLEGRRWRFDEEDRKTVRAFWVFQPLFLVVPAFVLVAVRRVADFLPLRQCLAEFLCNLLMQLLWRMMPRSDEKSKRSEP